jgi:hypothetical protein
VGRDGELGLLAEQLDNIASEARAHWELDYAR